MVGRNPTHLDSHQHAHRHEPVRSAAVSLARELGVPLREFSTGIQYCGRFYGQTTHGLPLPEAISVESLMAILRNLPAGLTEISCHPGRTIGDALSYGNERSTEVDVLSHPQVRSLLSSEGIELRSFREPVNELRPADARDLSDSAIRFLSKNSATQVVPDQRGLLDSPPWEIIETCDSANG